MKIIDCTTYYSEDLMLDIRLNILNEYVDKFIIVESKFSHSGEKKSLNFNINNFSKFKDKIEYLIIEDEPEGIMENKNNNRSIKRMNSLLRIEQSYNFISNALIDVSDNDLICLSDNDEIPNFESINFKNSRNDIFIFKQLFFYYKFNLFYDLMPWFGTKACKKKKLISLSWLRNLKNKKYPWWRLDTYFSKNKQINLQIVNDGGWHFTNIKTAEQIKFKLESYLHHIEFDQKPLSTSEISEIIKNKTAIYNLSVDQRENKVGGDKLEKYPMHKLPKYLQDNFKKYKEWID